MATEHEPEARRVPRVLLLLLVLLGVVLLLIVWNRAAASPRLCSTCHAMDQAVESASRSVHRDVPCLACHSRPGLLGSLRYIPTFAREGVATLTGWNVAGGVLNPTDCRSCHPDLATSPSLKIAHAEEAQDCGSCHGEVAHPTFDTADPGVSPGLDGDPHPDGYVQTHGEDYVGGSTSCTVCHRPSFCEVCHFRSSFPHPENWIEEHGAVQRREGAETCAFCHPTTFCVGCHGTEIPHRETWLGEHWRSLQDASVSPCLECHPKTDCTTCHSEHGIHREQDLYSRASP